MEMRGWDENEAHKEVSMSTVSSDAALIPIGELYSIRRWYRYKYWQTVYGNLLP